MLPAETQTERIKEKHIYLFFPLCVWWCVHIGNDICSSDWIFNLSCKVNYDGREVEMRGEGGRHSNDTVKRSGAEQKMRRWCLEEVIERSG